MLMTYFDIAFTIHNFIKSSVNFKYGIPLAHVHFSSRMSKKIVNFS